MNYLKSSIQSMVGSRAEDETENGAAIVEQLTERLQYAVTYEDRRDAVRTIKSLSKRYRLDVGAHCIPHLINTLKKDASYAEITALILETLNHVVGGDLDEDNEYSEAENQDLGERFAEALIKNKENVELFLSLVEGNDFNVRLPAIRLFTSLLRYQCKELQELLLATPGSIPRLTDLLQEQREVVRNEAVLLIFELIRANSNIQKTVAFQNVFERLLDIVYEEGDSIIAEDCLYVVLHLLRNNGSNQHLFRENSHIQTLAPILNLLTKGIKIEEVNPAPLEVTWTSQRISNVHLLFQVIRALVSPSNQVNATSGCQKLAAKCNLLANLGELIMSGGVPADVLTEAINALAELIRGCAANQHYFEQLTELSVESPQSAIVVLLLSMGSEKQPFPLRCAVLYCIQSYLYKNETGKQAVLDTLLPESVDSNTSLTAGHVLCTGLISSDSLLVWFSCCALLHCLVDVPVSLKERLLNVQLATGVGQPPVTLMQQTISLLIHSQQTLSKLGILMFLSAWLANCPVAVSKLLQQPTVIPFLTAQVGGSDGDDLDGLPQNLCAFVFGLCLLFNDDTVEKFNRKNLGHLLERRIGIDVLLAKLESVSKSEFYARAAQRAQLKAKVPQDVAFDHEFTNLFRTLEQQIVRMLNVNVNTSRQMDTKTLNGHLDAVVSSLPHSAEEHQQIVSQYKSIIKRQDEELTRVKEELLEREKKGKRDDDTQIDSLSNQLNEKCRLLEIRDKEVHDLQAALSSNEAPQLRDEVAVLRLQLEQKTNECFFYQQQAQTWQNQLSVEFTSRDPSGLIAHLQQQCQEMDGQLAYGFQIYEQQQQDLAVVRAECDSLKQQLADGERWRQEAETFRVQLEQLNARAQESAADNQKIQKMNADLAKMDQEKQQLMSTLESIRKEHEDLLLLLADQDIKLKQYKRRLVQIFKDTEVSHDEEDEDDDVTAGQQQQRIEHHHSHKNISLEGFTVGSNGIM